MAIVLRYKCDIFMTENFANLDFVGVWAVGEIYNNT